MILDKEDLQRLWRLKKKVHGLTTSNDDDDDDDDDGIGAGDLPFLPCLFVHFFVIFFLPSSRGHIFFFYSSSFPASSSSSVLALDPALWSLCSRGCISLLLCQTER